MLRGFSRKSVYTGYLFGRSLQVLLGSTDRADLPTQSISTPFNALFRQGAQLSLLLHLIAQYGGTGILTSCPSNTPFGFSLGPDLPADD